MTLALVLGWLDWTTSDAGLRLVYVEHGELSLLHEAERIARNRLWSPLRAASSVLLNAEPLAFGAMSGLCYKFLATGTCPYGSKCKFSHGASTTARTLSYTPTRAFYSSSVIGNPSDGPQNVAEFFAAYPGFQYDSSHDCMTERRRLCKHLDLDPDDNNNFKVRDMKRQLRKALVRQFNTRYGTDANRLEGWQALCRAVGIPVPAKLKECREAIQATHVNLVDLTEHLEESGFTVVVFPTEKALSTYTLVTEKVFPRNELEAGNLLRMLLRRILDPPPEREVVDTPQPSNTRPRRRRQ